MDKKGKILLSLLLFFPFIINAQILQPIKWRIELKDAKSGEKMIVFTASIDKGWHLYNMNLPEGGPVSTSFHFDNKKGVSLVGKTVSKLKPITKKDEVFGLELSWYENKAVFIQKINIPDEKNFLISGNVEYMGCNDKSCLPPNTEDFTFKAGNPQKAASSKAVSQKSDQGVSDIKEASQLPSSGIPKLNSKDSIQSNGTDSLVRQDKGLLSEDILWKPVSGQLPSYGQAASTEKSSWWILFFSGFIGGLLALLTPCIWPIIPMTVSFFLKRSKKRRTAIKESIFYGLSIIAIYLILGLGITLIFGASALNSLSTNAIFNLLFFALLVIFAISFFGAFEIVLPSSWTNKVDKKADTTSGIISIFFMAFTLALVSFSCTGPIIGTLLVQAASMGSIGGPAIGMAGFALALAIPFSLFAIFPNMLQNLPKSGGWLNTVKVILGFIELAFSLKFLSVADMAYGWGILSRETFISIWTVLFAILGFYLLGKIRLPNDSKIEHVSVLRLFLAMISLSFALYMVPGLWGAPLKAISAFAPPTSTQDFNLNKNETHAAFTDYESGMTYARQKGKPVMIDFSGYGCVNCRKMENSVWQDSRVKEILDNDYVLITLMVDDKTRLKKNIQIEEFGKTRELKTIGDKWSYLQRYKFRANSQPFYVLLNNEGQPIGPSYAYDTDAEKFLGFLKDGLRNFRKND